MEASIIDLRYNMKAVQQALQRNEVVKIKYHGKLIGKILPCSDKDEVQPMNEHPFFGMLQDEKETVDEVMDTLRGGRYDDL